MRIFAHIDNLDEKTVSQMSEAGAGSRFEVMLDNIWYGVSDDVVLHFLLVEEKFSGTRPTTNSGQSEDQESTS